MLRAETLDTEAGRTAGGGTVGRTGEAKGLLLGKGGRDGGGATFGTGFGAGGLTAGIGVGFGGTGLTAGGLGFFAGAGDGLGVEVGEGLFKGGLLEGESRVTGFKAGLGFAEGIEGLAGGFDILDCILYHPFPLQDGGFMLEADLEP